MSSKKTKKITYVRLSESRIMEIEDLVYSWPYETKAFMRARLNQYTPKFSYINFFKKIFLFFFVQQREREFTILKNPEILTDWQMRFEVSGETNPQHAWTRIMESEVSSSDYQYILALLDRELSDVHVPPDLWDTYEGIYRAHIRKEYLTDSSVPKAPLILVTGPSGSGKTVTTTEAIEKVIFGNEVHPEVNYKKKKEERLSGESVWTTLEEVEPELALEITKKKRIDFYKRLSKIPIIKKIFKKRIGKNLMALEEQGVMVDYSIITPNDYQTAYAGEPGNYLRKAMGNPDITTIRHIEEAHSAFGKVESGMSSGMEGQQHTLIDTSNILLDEIIHGRRDCLLIATTDKPERIDPAIYLRFVEKGKIIDISEYWLTPSDLNEIICIELKRSHIRVGDPREVFVHKEVIFISKEDLNVSVETIYRIFKERNLKVTPAYVRKLVQSIVEIKSNFCNKYLNDDLLVRSAFKMVAENTYGDLFKKVVDKMDRNVKWEDYVGGVKNQFSEMIINCLSYGVSEEKGVVLTGPPGSGKTFLVRSWLSENKDIHDITTSPGALHDPSSPVDGTVANLEKVYDIAKMIAPSIVFVDEGDALAPRRSASGGTASDKLTNKFLSIIDGEIPLNKVFTVLTTNRIDVIDPALIRSKRLKVLEITGYLSQKDIAKIMALTMEGINLSSDINVDTIMELAKGICNTPADYTSYAEKARSLCSTEYMVLQAFRDIWKLNDKEKENFIKFNFKTMIGIMESLKLPTDMRMEVAGNPNILISDYKKIVKFMADVEDEKDYPLRMTHLSSARREIAQSPVRKGSVQLSDYLETELSQEPQVGFIIGVGANDVTGTLLPIATSLTYNLGPAKVLVTGAVSSQTSSSVEMDMAVQMTQQSAQEALTMIKNYLQSLTPKIGITKLMGKFIEEYSIHHQLLSASYNVGGPSAGYALAINTLSALLNIPVCNDFGITGAPWTKGVRKDEVGGSVIIGGHKKKTEKVLLYLRRMYMPFQNYKDLEYEFLVNYWTGGKDILAVTHFADLIPEVVWLSDGFDKILEELIGLRIEYKLKKYHGETRRTDTKNKILKLKQILRKEFETITIQRILSIRQYLENKESDPYISIDEIYKMKA